MSATNVTTVCNLALGKLGEKRIMSIDDNDPVARQCRLFYAQTRDEVLRASRWNFAIKRVPLVRLSTTPEFGWSYQYQLPNDCLRVLQINGWEATERQDEWQVEAGLLLCDEDTVQLRYIARIEDAATFDPLFTEALSVKLAAKLAQSVTGSREMPGMLISEYERLVGPKARRTDAFENNEKKKPAWVGSDLVSNRYGGLF